MYTQGPRDERFTRGEGIPGIATTPAKMKSASNRTSVIPTQRSARACRQAATFTGGDQREPRYLMPVSRLSPVKGASSLPPNRRRILRVRAHATENSMARRVVAGAAGRVVWASM